MEMASGSLREREHEIAREVAFAFLSATSRLEVYRLALAALTPYVRARFSSVFEPDPQDPSLLKLTCAHSWPQSSARFLGHLRLRVGRGPTGRAVADAQPVAVRDVFADPALREWWEPARELGFVSLISLPLLDRDTARGALTFYFAEPHDFDDDERHLLQWTAAQVAAASARAEATDSLRRELERLRAENQHLRENIGAAEETKRLKDEFLSNVGHELRTPLTSILGYANLLTTGEAGELGAAQRAAVVRMEHAATVLLRLITDLLDLYQLKLGRTLLNDAPDDAVLIAKRALQAAGDPPEGVTVELKPESDRLPLHVDGEKVVKVLENLLSNAYKFTTAGSVRVTVRARSDDGDRTVEWIVADTGIGISLEQQDAVFDEFRQVDGSSTRLYGGTGLGLALSRQLTRLLGGRLTLESVPGAGSTFTLRVPVAPAVQPS